jgi:tetratricopeptide (TPR) repeat protein
MSADFFPLLYVAGLLILLGTGGFFIFRQVLKTRRIESTFNRLQTKLNREKGTALECYELGSILLDKRLYSQAIVQFQKAIKLGKVDDDALAAIYNALGFAYFAQAQYDLAMKQYKQAIQLAPQYVTAWNNLGHAYERKQLTQKALEAYEQAMACEPNNDTAKRRAAALKKRLAPSAS